MGTEKSGRAWGAALSAALLLGLAGSVPAAEAESGSDGLASAMEVQVRLSRHGVSPGVIDGKWGQNTRGALAAFQEQQGLEATGELDEATAKALGEEGATVEHTLTEEDLAGPFADIPEDLMEQAKLESLAYTSPIEKLAESFHTTPETLRRLNPDLELAAGKTIEVPNVRRDREIPEAGGERTIQVDKSDMALRLTDGDGKLLFYAPVAAGSEKAPLPMGEWKVTGVAADPTFSYDPELFYDSAPGDEETTLPPGPNNPVGVLWIDLSKEHYGIHGTSEPSTVGYAATHGCVRLTNWDARYLGTIVEPGVKVIFQE